MNKAVVIIIGRNRTSGLVLSADEWGEFQARFVTYLASFGGSYYRTVQGMGFSVGGVEENVSIFGSIPRRMVDGLREVARKAAHAFGQDGVLLLIGEAEYIQ